MNVAGTSTFNNMITALSSLNVSGNTTLMGASTISSTLNIAGVMTAASTSILNGASTHNSTLFVAGAITANSSLNISGATIINGSSTFLSNLNVSGVANIGNTPLDTSTALSVNNMIKLMEYGLVSTATTSYSTITENTSTSQTSRYMGNISLPAGFVDGSSISVVMIGTRGPGYGYIEGGSYIQDTTDTIRFIQLVYGNEGASGTATVSGSATVSLTASMFPLKAYKYSAYPGWSVSAMTLNVTINYNASATGISSSFQQISTQGTYNISDNRSTSSRLYINSVGNIGIGNTAPSALLHISGTSILNGASTHVSTLYISGATTLNSTLNIVSLDNITVTTTLLNFKNVSGYGIYADSQSIGARGNTLDFKSSDFNVTGTTTTRSVLTMRPEGTIGINTSNPLGQLHVEGATSILGTSTGGSNLIINDIPGARWRISTGSYALNFFKHTGTTTSDFSSWSQRMILDQNGYLGIGTTTPAYPLTVNTVNNTAGLVHTTGTVTVATWADSARGGFLGTISNHPLGFYTNNGGALVTISTAGNMGIGTTTPAYKLDVTGDINFTGTLYNNGVAFSGGGGGSSQWTTSGANIYYNNGNVGIGTTTPSYKLHIEGNVNGDGIVNLTKNTNSSGFAASYWGTDQASVGVIFKNGSARSADGGVNTLTLRNDGGDLRLQSAGANNSIHIKGTSGNVGIGTISPNAVLHVNQASASGTGYGGLLVDSPNSGSAGGTITIRNSSGGINAFASLIFETDGSTSCTTGTTPIGFTQGNGMIYCMNTNGSNAAKLGFIQWNGSAEVETMTILPSGNVGIGTTAPVGILDVQNIVRMGNYSGGSYDNIEFVRGTGSGQYPNIRCQNNYFGLYVSDVGGWCGDSQVGDMVMRPYGAFRIGVNGANSALTVSSASRVGIGVTTPAYKLDIAGSMHVASGDDSMTYYGPNSTWNARLIVGAGTDKSAASTAQVISTNGNLHLDGGNSNSIYYGHYPNARGAPNTHEFYGSTINFNSGLPQQTDTYAYPVVLCGVGLKRSVALVREIYRSNSVGWTGGVNITYAFHKYNVNCSVKISGHCSGYTGGATHVYPTFRLYSHASGAYTYYESRSFTNFGGNHVCYPIDYWVSPANIPNTGWYDLYFYSGGGLFSDSNDRLQLNVTILPGSDY
jgi:hypothetical protein